MELINFTEIEDEQLKLEEIHGALLGLYYGITKGFEKVEEFDCFFYKTICEVDEVKNKLKEMTKRLIEAKKEKTA